MYIKFLLTPTNPQEANDALELFDLLYIDYSAILPPRLSGTYIVTKRTLPRLIHSLTFLWFPRLLSQ